MLGKSICFPVLVYDYEEPSARSEHRVRTCYGSKGPTCYARLVSLDRRRAALEDRRKQ